MTSRRGRGGTWFQKQFGFKECKSYAKTRSQFSLEDGGATLVSLANKKKFDIGVFELLSVSELRKRREQLKTKEQSAESGGGLTFRNVKGDVSKLIRDPKNAGAVFQAASQFNCLEMANPRVTPDNGVTIYKWDRTQGPACALACPAATVFRNYLVNGKGQGGDGEQIDGLADVAKVLGEDTEYWRLMNGYAFPTSAEKFKELNDRLESDKELRAKALEALKIGIHWSTEVERQPAETDPAHKVCQLYCSAVPIAYSRLNASQWAEFAQLVLDAAYESSFLAASIIAAEQKRRVPLYLTLLGGGVFGNPTSWIVNAIKAAIKQYSTDPIDVRIVHYSHMPELCATIKAPELSQTKKVENEEKSESSEKTTTPNQPLEQQKMKNDAGESSDDQNLLESKMEKLEISK
eukprot:jgi/Bigna1/88006/estExt_fgenesh1_pg.C_270030